MEKESGELDLLMEFEEDASSLSPESKFSYIDSVLNPSLNKCLNELRYYYLRSFVSYNLSSTNFMASLPTPNILLNGF